VIDYIYYKKEEEKLVLKELIQEFNSVREINLMRIKEAKDNGRKVVGIYCTYCPQELVLAAGAIPVGLCGTSEAPIAAAEESLPRNLCPLIKSSYGFAVTDTCPFFHFSDLVIGETTCDGKKKMFEIMQDIKPVHVMQLPHLNNTQASFDLWVDELRRLKLRLEGIEREDH
jgi:benzoyl-CoA reductase/2-hydroxyglutaryl-CoA dehydratase subunit BcrC/BadD/HgdB